MRNGTTKDQFYKLQTRKDVATMLNISEKSLRYFLYKVRPENMYHSFTITKKDGTLRTISAPNDKLKSIQRKLAKILSEVYKPKVCAYGFIDNKNHIINAQQHIKRRLVLNIDLKDFFSQIHFGRARGMFMSAPYYLGDEAATTLAQIACYNGILPQGSPSSPIITNMICAPLDNALMKLAKENGCVYTRYADDITFSTHKHEFDKSIVYIDSENIIIGSKLAKELATHSFLVNPEKITLRSRSSRQEVTGLTVNEFPNLRRSYTKQLRAIIHNCEKYGILNAAKHYVDKGLCTNPIIYENINSPKHEDLIVNWFKQVLTGKTYYIKQVKGSTSPTYLTFAQKINQLFDESIFDISHLNRFDNIVKNSVFILQHLKEDSWIQGSAFYLSGYGLFTNYHVTESGDIFSIYNTETFEDAALGYIGKSLNEIYSSRSIDYALYKAPTTFDCKHTFKCGDSSNLKIGDQVTIIGFPNYQKGNSPYIQSCNITSRKTFMGSPFFTVGGRITHGSSGGVVLNTNEEVVGIIKGGIVTMAEDDYNENQGFVPLHIVLEHLNTNSVHYAN